MNFSITDRSRPAVPYLRQSSANSNSCATRPCRSMPAFTQPTMIDPQLDPARGVRSVWGAAQCQCGEAGQRTKHKCVGVGVQREENNTGMNKGHTAWQEKEVGTHVCREGRRRLRDAGYTVVAGVKGNAGRAGCAILLCVSLNIAVRSALAVLHGTVLCSSAP